MTIPSITQVVKIADVVIAELNSFFIEGDIVDENGLPIPLVDVTAFTLQLYDDSTGDILNSRDAVDILNANGGTYHATNGHFTMGFYSADSPIHGTGLARGAKEIHTARFTLTWGLTGRWDGEVKIKVINLNKVP